MAIKVSFLTGEIEKRTASLYQWDYGQTLEIEAPYLPTVVEVHFACRDMKEAIVCVCSATLGVATVTIPDLCLEHTGEITAWVYGIEGTSGRTMYRITIPIISRARPSRTEANPEKVQDISEQLISEMNEAFEKMVEGNVVVTAANHANTADRASTADTASHASSAQLAEMATKDGDGNVITDTYQRKTQGEFQNISSFASEREAGGTYLFQMRVTCDYNGPQYTYVSSAIVTSPDLTSDLIASFGVIQTFSDIKYQLVLRITRQIESGYIVFGYPINNDSVSEWNVSGNSTFSLQFRKI